MAKIKCSACGQVIHGKYIKAVGASWHPDCFRCAACGESFQDKGFIEKQGKPYHQHCYHQLFSPRCSGCKQPIEGSYLRALNKLWHPEHFVCSHCGEPIGESYFVHRGKPYCKQDYLLLFAEKCRLCGAVLEDRYNVDMWGNKYCPRHEEDPRCISCDRFIGKEFTGGGVRYADGRDICQDCARTAVHEVSDAHRILKDIQKILENYEFHFNRKLKLPLELVGLDILQTSLPRRRRNHNPAGVTQTHIETLFGAESGREILRIQALYGLPPEHLGAVLAHELGHVWLFLNRFPVLPSRLEEGICELMASYWLKSQPGDLARLRLKILEKNPNPIYGRGYRVVRKVVANTSLAYVLDHVKRHAALPKV